jgi:hypothetical protein
MPAPVIQFKRGSSSGITSFRAGEPAFTTDTFDFYIGLDNTLTNNKFFGSHRYWTKETASKGSGVNLVESSGGSDFITLAAPASVGAAVTYYFPANQGASSSVLTNDGSGNLSWSSGSENATFTGITTFSDTTDNTLGNADTGAVQIDGGVGINKNVTIGQSLHVSQHLNVTGVTTFQGNVNLGDNDKVYFGDGNDLEIYHDGSNSYIKDAGTGSLILDTSKLEIKNAANNETGLVFTENGSVDLYYDNSKKFETTGVGATVTGNLGVSGNLYVAGESEFVGVVTFRGGTINLGDSDTDNIVLTADVNSDILPNTTSTFDLGSSSKRWGGIYGTSLNVSGISSLGGAIVTGFTSLEDLTITGITTISGTIDGLSTLEIDGLVTFNGGQIVTGVSTFNGPIDANSDLSVDGITTLNGNLVSAGFSTFQNGVTMNSSLSVSGNTTLSGSLGVTGISTFSNNVNVTGSVDVTGNLRVSGITTIGDSSADTLTVNATTTFNQPIVGTIGTATRATTVDTTATSTNAEFYPTFVSSSASETSATVRVDSGVSYNPSTNALTVPTINTQSIKTSGGVNSIEITEATGNVGISSNLTVTGNLYVLGSTTEVNTETLKVEDSLIEVGLVNSGGSLVPPTSDLNIDVGILFNWYDSSAKKAGVFWDDSTGRIVLGKDLTETNSVMSITTYADVHIGSLWVTDCAGTSQVVSCTDSQRFLENITVDGGSF